MQYQREKLDFEMKKIIAAEALIHVGTWDLDHYVEESLQYVVDELQKLISPNETLEAKRGEILLKFQSLSLGLLELEIGENFKSIRNHYEIETIEAFDDLLLKDNYSYRVLFPES